MTFVIVEVQSQQLLVVIHVEMSAYDRYIVEQICARYWMNCAFCDKSMKLGTWFLDTIRSILRNGATSNLTFGDL